MPYVEGYFTPTRRQRLEIDLRDQGAMVLGLYHGDGRSRFIWPQAMSAASLGPNAADSRYVWPLDRIGALLNRTARARCDVDPFIRYVLPDAISLKASQLQGNLQAKQGLRALSASGGEPAETGTYAEDDTPHAEHFTPSPSMPSSRLSPGSPIVHPARALLSPHCRRVGGASQMSAMYRTAPDRRHIIPALLKGSYLNNTLGKPSLRCCWMAGSAIHAADHNALRVPEEPARDIHHMERSKHSTLR